MIQFGWKKIVLSMAAVAIVVAVAGMGNSCSQLDDSGLTASGDSIGTITPSTHGTLTISLSTVDTSNHYDDSLKGNNSSIKAARPELAHPIIIIRKSDFSFVAFYAPCSYDKCDLNVSNGYLICPCCHSEFESENGTVSTKPATEPITKFATVYDSIAKTVMVSY